MSEWEAHLHEGPSEWAARTTRLTLFRRLPGGGGEQITGWSGGGHPIVEQVEEGALLHSGFLVPTEALPSLRDAIEPGPTSGEVKRLEDALAVERARVDRALDAGTVAADVTGEQLSEAWFEGWFACQRSGGDFMKTNLPGPVAPGLLDVLRKAGAEWGPLGVAVVAADLTDAGALLRHLAGERDRRETPVGTLGEE